MPAKNKILNYIYNLLCKDAYTAKALLEAIHKKYSEDACAIRTLQDYLKILKGKTDEQKTVYIKQIGKGKKTTYIAIDKDIELTLQKVPALDAESKGELQVFHAAISQLKVFQFSSELASILEEIGASATVEHPTIYFGNIQSDVLPINMKKLVDAIYNTKPVSFTYSPYHNGREKIITLHPYFLKQYNYRWYVLGYCTHQKKVMHYGIERIDKLKLLQEEPFFISIA